MIIVALSPPFGVMMHLGEFVRMPSQARQQPLIPPRRCRSLPVMHLADSYCGAADSVSRTDSHDFPKVHIGFFWMAPPDPFGRVTRVPGR